MKRRIVVQEHHFQALRGHLLRGPNEQAAVCLGGWVATDRLLAILIREVHLVPTEALVTQSGAFIEVDPAWLAALVKRARQAGLSLLIAHSHPFSRHTVAFSGTDTGGQAQLIPKLQARVGGVPHAEAVFGQSSVEALMWPTGEPRPLPVEEFRVLGAWIEDVPMAAKGDDIRLIDPSVGRQVLFLGEEGQRRLSDMRVGVVGAGGDGSAVAAELIHLRVGELAVVEPQLVDGTNRNRLIDGQEADDGQTPKVELIRRYAARVASSVRVEAIQAPVEEAWARIRDCDVIFGCTDDLSSRYVLNRLAAQYLIPLIDTGVEIEVLDGSVRTIAGRVNVVRPGGRCLEALGFTGPEVAAAELRTRKRPGYVEDEPAAAAMPANMLVAGAAGVEFLKLVHGLFGGSPPDRYWAYSARSGELRGCEAPGRACETCASAAGLGDAGPPPILPDQTDLTSG